MKRIIWICLVAAVTLISTIPADLAGAAFFPETLHGDRQTMESNLGARWHLEM